MKVLTAKVVDGRLDVPEGSLEEGTTVTLLVPEDEDEDEVGGFRLSEEERAFLAESIAQGERGEVIDGWQLLDDLKN